MLSLLKEREFVRSSMRDVLVSMYIVVESATYCQNANNSAIRRQTQSCAEEKKNLLNNTHTIDRERERDIRILIRRFSDLFGL